MIYKRYELSWTFANIDGHPHSQRETMTNRRDALAAYDRKVEANRFLLGGASITKVRLHQVEVTEDWTLIAGVE